MSDVNWQEVLGWNEEQLDDIRLTGCAYIQQGLYDSALKFFEALAVVTKNNLFDLQTLGALYLQNGDNLSALNYLERALKIDRTDETTLLNRAKALFLLGYKRQGLIQARELEKSPNRTTADSARALTLAYA